jgi:hypothetical protein
MSDFTTNVPADPSRWRLRGGRRRAKPNLNTDGEWVSAVGSLGLPLLGHLVLLFLESSDR